MKAASCAELSVAVWPAATNRVSTLVKVRPGSKTVLAFTRTVSVSVPPSTVSVAAVSPVPAKMKRSAPWPPDRVSAPAPPVRVSSPSLPQRDSAPIPPFSTSAPVAPEMATVRPE